MKKLFPILFAIVGFSCASDVFSDLVPNRNQEMLDAATIWDGPAFIFEKASNANPNSEAAQDRITENVWITRDNDGILFNAAQENEFNREVSPAGTIWAFGRVSDDLRIEDFQPFRILANSGSNGGPRTIVGDDLVLYLTEENIIMNVNLTSWERGARNGTGGGGFSYTRSANPDPN